MCGIVGYTSKEGAVSNPEIIRKLMRANDTRGGHSSGYYDGSSFKKCIGRSNNLHAEMRGLSTKTFIGHTRYSTHGERTLPNQHPFQYGNVIGCHNGVVHNYKEVGEKYGLSKTEVDSQMIFKVMNHTQHLDILGLFSGALATIFQKNDRFYSYRRVNPLYVGRDGMGGVYFSSIKESLEDCNLKEIFLLKESRIYVWDGDEIVDRIDIEHCPVEEKYVQVRKQWWEYGNDNTSTKGITDRFEGFGLNRAERNSLIKQGELFEDTGRCSCQDDSSDFCWC